MEWALAAVAGLVVFLYGRSHQWWGGTAAAALPPGPAPIVCDVETDMPDSVKQAVLAQVASQKDPATLQAFAQTLMEGGYIQSGYCLLHRAWVLGGSKGAAPTPPTAAQITAAQAARAAAAGGAANLGQMSLGQMQVAPGMPNINVNVGTMISVIGATPYDATSNPTGFTVDTDATVASAMAPTVYAITAPGTITFHWSPTSSTTLTATGSAAQAAVAAASTVPNPPPIAPSTPSAVPAAQANPTPPAAPGTVPGLDPNAVAAAAAQLAQSLTNAATQAAVANVQPTTTSGRQAPFEMQ